MNKPQVYKIYLPCSKEKVSFMPGKISALEILFTVTNPSLLSVSSNFTQLLPYMYGNDLIASTGPI